MSSDILNIFEQGTKAIGVLPIANFLDQVVPCFIMQDDGTPVLGLIDNSTKEPRSVDPTDLNNLIVSLVYFAREQLARNNGNEARIVSLEDRLGLTDRRGSNQPIAFGQPERTIIEPPKHISPIQNPPEQADKSSSIMSQFARMTGQDEPEEIPLVHTPGGATIGRASISDGE